MAKGFSLSKEEVMLREISLNSIEDIYDFLWYLDFIHMHHIDGNEYATCLYNDFLGLIEQMEDYEEGLTKYIKLYHDVQIGNVSLKEYDNLNCDMGIIEIIAMVCGENMKEIAEKLHDEVTEMVEFNKLTWIRVNKNRYKDIKIEFKEKNVKPAHMNEEKLVKLDYMKKYTHHENRYISDFKPREIEELEKYRENIRGKLKITKEKMNKYKMKDDKRFADYKSIYSKLIATEIQINKDIGEIKKHYGMLVGTQNRKGTTVTISYDSNNNYILRDHDDMLKKERIRDFEISKAIRDAEKLSSLAEKVLTQRQLLIYKFYYKNGYTQQEIANIIGSHQPNVHRDIKNITNKLKKNYENDIKNHNGRYI